MSNRLTVDAFAHPETCFVCREKILNEPYDWMEGDPICSPKCIRDYHDRIAQGTEPHSEFAFDDR